MQFSVDAPNLSHVDFPCAYSPYTPNLSHLDFPWILDAAKVNSHRTAHAAGKHPPLPRTITSVQGYSVNFRPFLSSPSQRRARHAHRASSDPQLPTCVERSSHDLYFLHPKVESPCTEFPVRRSPGSMQRSPQGTYNDKSWSPCLAYILRSFTMPWCVNDGPH